MGHTVSQTEIDAVREMVSATASRMQ